MATNEDDCATNQRGNLAAKDPNEEVVTETQVGNDGEGDWVNISISHLGLADRLRLLVKTTTSIRSQT